jgi:hypothetical protein
MNLRKTRNWGLDEKRKVESSFQRFDGGEVEPV